jgi:hypothetical protein
MLGLFVTIVNLPQLQQGINHVQLLHIERTHRARGDVRPVGEGRDEWPTDREAQASDIYL